MTFFFLMTGGGESIKCYFISSSIYGGSYSGGFAYIISGSGC
jgi:hypothetical protein